MRTVRFTLIAAALAGAVSAAGAQAAAASATAAAPTSGYRAEFLSEMKYFEGRFMQLAEAIPADKFTWRPAAGVRSVAEVLLHVAAANQGLPRMAGVQPPSGFSGQGYEASTTDKAKIIAELKKSFAHVQAAVYQGDAETGLGAAGHPDAQCMRHQIRRVVEDDLASRLPRPGVETVTRSGAGPP